jgi:hypothetical protein
MVLGSRLNYFEFEVAFDFLISAEPTNLYFNLVADFKMKVDSIICHFTNFEN